MPKTCIFSPTRKNIPPCVEEAVTPWGFCKKHSKTQQALKAHEQYEESLSNRSNPIPIEQPKSALKKTPEQKEEPAPRGRPKKEEEPAPRKRSRRDEEEPSTPRRGKSSKEEESPPRRAQKEEPKRTLAKRNPAPTKKPSKKNSDSESDGEENTGSTTTVRKNRYGNYEDSKTHLVFDPATKAAYGKQVGSKVEPLTKRDIELCEDKGWPHVVPKQSKMASTLNIKGSSRKAASSDEEEDDDEDEEDYQEEDEDDQEDSRHSDDD